MLVSLKSTADTVMRMSVEQRALPGRERHVHHQHEFIFQYNMMMRLVLNRHWRLLGHKNLGHKNLAK